MLWKTDFLKGLKCWLRSAKTNRFSILNL